MISKDSVEWPKLKAAFQARIEEHRNSLESATCGIKEADLLRGRIIELRALIETVEPELIEQAAPTVAPRSNY